MARAATDNERFRSSLDRGTWRALTSFDQAVLYPVWIRHDFTFAELGAHFGISTDRARAYATETVEVLAAQAPDLAEGLRAAGPERHAVLDGTLVTTDRCHTPPAGYVGTNQDPYYSGKHHRHGVNLQGVIGLDGELLSPRDQRANREHACVRCHGERGFAQLKAFKVLRPVRISPGRTTKLARSIHTVIRLRTSLAGV